MMRPRTIVFLLIAALAFVWYAVEPTTGPGGSIQTPLPQGFPNIGPILLAMFLVLIIVWSWGMRGRRKERR